MKRIPRYDAVAIGRRLRWLRGELGGTQAEMAVLLEISLSHYSKLEIGVGRMSRKLVECLCEKTGVVEKWFLEGVEDAWPDGKPTKLTLGSGTRGICLRETGEPYGRDHGLLTMRVPDDAMMEKIVALALAPETQALAEQTAKRLKIPMIKAMTALIRAVLQSGT